MLTVLLFFILGAYLSLKNKDRASHEQILIVTAFFTFIGIIAGVLMPTKFETDYVSTRKIKKLEKVSNHLVLYYEDGEIDQVFSAYQLCKSDKNVAQITHYKPDSSFQNLFSISPNKKQYKIHYHGAKN